MVPLRGIAAALTLIVVSSLAAAQDSSGGVSPVPDSSRRFVPPATIAELEARIRQLLDSTKTPGAGLAMVRDDSVIYTGGFGRAQVAPERPATAATLFRIGSTSKAFVALAAMQLQREGKLSLQDPIRTHLPDFWFKNAWEETDPVRIVHLLEHTAGFDDNSLRTYANNDPTPLTLAQGLALDSTTRVSRWRPGTRFSYCNTGPAIVALVVERIEGKPFEQVVQERFFDRIGMRTATYLFPDTTRVAMAELYRGDGKTPYPYWHVFIRPAGSINAAATDMAQYLRFLLGRGTIGGDTLLPREDIERMERPGTWIGARAGMGIGYGLHLYTTSDTTGFVWTGHNGGVEGGLSDLSYIPGAGVGYATQINSGNGAVQQHMARLVRGYLTRSIARPVEPPVGHAPAAVAAEFGGWYRPVSPRQQHLYFLERLAGLARVWFTGDSVRVRPLTGAQRALVPVDSLRFRRPGESVVTAAFHRDEANGRPQALELGLGSMARASSVTVLVELGLAAAWMAGVVAGLAALALVPIRWLVRRLRKRPRRDTAARPLWRAAGAASVLVAAPFVALAVGGAGIAELGNLTLVSGTVYGAGILFAAWAVFGLGLAVRRRAATGRWQAVSLWAARGILAVHAVAAGYLIYWGPIGWRTW